MGSRVIRSYHLSSALFALAITGCAGRVDREQIRIALSDASSCLPPAGVARITLRALGDVPARSARAIDLVQMHPIGSFGELGYAPLSIEAVAEGPRGWRGLGAYRIGDRGGAILLLPPALSCGLADPEARAPIGAALGITYDGALVIAGGLEDGIGTRRVALLAPGAQSVEMGTIRLGVQTAFATATGTEDGRVVIAGGAIEAEAAAYDRYEEIDPDDPELRIVGELSGGRRDHSAILLRDGRIALIGGRADGRGEALSTIELLDRDRRRGARAPEPMLVARIAPTLALDDRGRVWIAGGQASGAAMIERFDPASGMVEHFEHRELPPPDALAFLPGERLAWIAGTRTRIVLLRESPIVQELLPEASALLDTHAIATPAGSLLVVGRGAAYVRDPGRGTIAPRETSIEPDAIAVLGDGSVVEISATGASLRREEEPRRYDDPPATIVPAFEADARFVLTDPIAESEGAFRVQGAALVSEIEGARLDVRSLRASRLDLVVRGTGALELLLVPDGAPELPIVLEGGSQVRVEGCALERGPRDPISIGPGSIAIGDRRCAIPALGLFGIAVRASLGSTIESIAISRP